MTLPPTAAYAEVAARVAATGAVRVTESLSPVAAVTVTAPAVIIVAEDAAEVAAISVSVDAAAARSERLLSNQPSCRICLCAPFISR
jgi:hypothetical protein